MSQKNNKRVETVNCVNFICISLNLILTLEVILGVDEAKYVVVNLY